MTDVSNFIRCTATSRIILQNGIKHAFTRAFVAKAKALPLANDTEHGLSSSICTSNLGAAHAFVSRAEADVTSVNLPTAGVELQPQFGGTKASGLGVKEQGRPVLDFYSEWRSVYMKVARVCRVTHFAVMQGTGFMIWCRDPFKMGPGGASF